MNRIDALKRAFSPIRYWWYRRSIGSPIPLIVSLREAFRRYRFERVNATIEIAYCPGAVVLCQPCAASLMRSEADRIDPPTNAQRRKGEGGSHD